jgi:hypothetical protein
MKVIGVKQFQQMKFNLLDLSASKFHGLLGKVPRHFIAVIYGFSGNGKTECSVQLSKELASMEMKTAWLSYEQRHGYDFQLSVNRNKMEEVSGYFYPIDPLAKVKPNVSLFEELDDYLGKRNSPEVVIIDSLDYLKLTFEQYAYLRNKYCHKKTFIFIAHASKNGRPIMRITERIIFDGGIGIFVSNYIARPEKNRFGGFEPYVVYEERARILNPAFFAKETQSNP